MTRLARHRAAWSLAIDELNYATSSERLGILTQKPHPAWRRGLVVNVAVFLGKLLRAITRSRFAAERPQRERRILVAIGSLNQQQAVQPVTARLDGVTVLSLHRDTAGAPFPEAAAYLASLAYLPRALAWRARARGYRRLGYELAFERYWLTYGYYLVACGVLGRARPELVLLANDHSMEMRVVERAARDLGFDTAYVQHASVSEGFPPLAFTISFLDGVDAAEKYDQPASETRVAFLTGIAKADAARGRVRPRADLTRVGLCLNALDPIDEVQRFTAEFARIAPQYELILRPHPSDRRAWRAALDVAGYSDPNTESPFAFLDRVDAIVSGPSNIMLEAALVDVPSLFVDFAGAGRDHYGFVRRGLCQKVAGAAEAVRVLGELAGAPPAEAVRAYCATIGTHYDGRSGELIGELIEEHLSGGIDLTRWRRREEFRHLTVYELRPTVS